MRRSIILHSRGFADGQDVDAVCGVWLSVPNRTSEQVFIPRVCFVISDGYNDLKFEFINCPTRCDVFSLLYFCRQLRVSDVDTHHQGLVHL